jgi:signal transduction histidine kinase
LVVTTARGHVAAASDRVEAQQRFLAYAAHELRTPLATQRALLELALTDPWAESRISDVGLQAACAC